MQTAIPFLLNMLTLISILLIVAMGLAIIFGLMNVINLAHGEFITVGAFTLVAVTNQRNRRSKSRRAISCRSERIE